MNVYYESYTLIKLGKFILETAANFFDKKNFFSLYFLFYAFIKKSHNIIVINP